LLGKYQEINKQLIDMMVRKLDSRSKALEKRLKEMEK